MASDGHRRLDQWLWFARFFKSRSLASRYCAQGRLRVNGTPVAKAHHALRAGDVLTFALGSRVRIIRVVAFGERRGPAMEARRLYEDLDPQPAGTPVDPPPAVARPPGAGRPTKAERRATDRLRGRA